MYTMFALSTKMEKVKTKMVYELYHNVYHIRPSVPLQFLAKKMESSTSKLVP